VATINTTDPTTSEVPNDGQEPERSNRANPTVAEAFTAWLQLATLTAVANVVIYAIASASGATMQADLGATAAAVEPVAVIVASYGTLLISTFVWALVAHRTPAFATLWVPLGFGVGLVSLAGIIGASDLSTGISLGAMHVLTTIVAALLIPRRLPR
jgi:hypothetical protein